MRVLAILGETADKDVPRTTWDVDQYQTNKQEITLLAHQLKYQELDRGQTMPRDH
jgi:hypothetical protein